MILRMREQKKVIFIIRVIYVKKLLSKGNRLFALIIL